MILDTSFLIDVLRGTDAVTDWEDQLDAQGGGMVTPITVMELWEGIHLTDARSEERTRVKQLLEGLNHAAFDQKSAMIAGEYSARLTAKGTTIEIEDIMIGAIARRHEEPVLTGNPEHFERLEGIAVNTY